MKPDPKGRTIQDASGRPVASSGKAVRVYIADDSFLIREGLRQVLEFAPEVQVIGQFDDEPSLLAAVDALAPDVVITDVRMPPTQTDEGMRIAERLRLSHPGLGVVVLSQHGSAQYAAQLLESGAAGRGYLLKDRIRVPLELRRVRDPLVHHHRHGLELLRHGPERPRAAAILPVPDGRVLEQRVLAALARVADDVRVGRDDRGEQQELEEHFFLFNAGTYLKKKVGAPP